MNFFLVSGFVWMSLVSVPLLGNSFEYTMRVSEAQNAYDRGDVGAVVEISKRLVRENKKTPDAYFLLGNVHLDKKLYKISLSYFLLAEKYQAFFEISEKKLELYLHLAANYYYLKNDKMHLLYLQKIISFSENKLKETNAGIYEKFYCEASFAMGHFYYQKKDFYKARKYLLMATKENTYKKSVYLLIAHYYSITPQEKIDADLKNHDRDILKTELRDSFFEFYYDAFKKASFSGAENNLLADGHYKSMISDVEYYHLNLKQQVNQKSLRP